jgi:hypothetical protein
VSVPTNGNAGQVNLDSPSEHADSRPKLPVWNFPPAMDLPGATRWSQSGTDMGLGTDEPFGIFLEYYLAGRPGGLFTVRILELLVRPWDSRLTAAPGRKPASWSPVPDHAFINISYLNPYSRSRCPARPRLLRQSRESLPGASISSSSIPMAPPL